jgi:hypothetical protein
MGVTVTSAGNVVVELFDGCLEFDHTWRQVAEPTRALTTKGVQLSMAGVAATPGGSLPDASLVLLSGGTLYRFTPDGKLAWKVTTLEGSDQSALPFLAPIAVDWSRGLIYLCDLSGGRIIKLADRAWCRAKGIMNDFEEKVAALRATKPPDVAGTCETIAQLYESTGPTFMAKALWQKVHGVDPGNQEAGARLLSIEVGDLKAAARDLDARARNALAAIGIETAVVGRAGDSEVRGFAGQGSR